MKWPFALLSIVAVLDACSPCGNEVRARAVSPGGDLEAVVFERSCGITTPFGTQISVQPAGDPPPDGQGNIFQLVQTDSAMSDPPGGPKVDVQWIGPRELHVRYDARADLTWAVARWGDLSVTYEPIRP